MDNLQLILSMVRSELERYPNQPPQFVLHEAEGRIRRTLGGTVMRINRLSKGEQLSRIRALPWRGMSTNQIAEVTGLSPSYIRELKALLADEPAPENVTTSAA
jgi:hypothetical protein